LSGLAILLGLCSLLVLLGALEYARHRRYLAQIPIRIHVNGTRGKSSVTRLIAAGLRAGGLRTCAKTTGTLARMIMPDGREYPIFRPAGANVIEQLRIVRRASELEAKVLVIECMAVQPTLQALSEAKLIRATHGVLTNAREDHLDVMGPTEADVALALVATAPVRGTLFTAERRHLETVRQAALDRASDLVAIDDAAVSAITATDLEGFKYIEHAENLALALTVCERLGVPRDTALRGMWSASPDPGVLTAHPLDFFGRRLTFINAFAANDPESTGRIWQLSVDRHPEAQRRIAVVNCRADRGDRSRQLGEACLGWGLADHYVLIGSGTYIFARSAIEAGLDPGLITYGEERRVEEIFETLVDLSGPSALLIGVANIGGIGLELVRYFKNRSTLPQPGGRP